MKCDNLKYEEFLNHNLYLCNKSNDLIYESTVFGCFSGYQCYKCFESKQEIRKEKLNKINGSV